jgi:hypothetical protein
VTCHYVAAQDAPVHTSEDIYTIRIKGRVATTELPAFPWLASELQGDETVLTGVLADQSAVFGVIGQIEGLGLELLELRRIRPRLMLAEPGHPAVIR